MMYKIVMTTLFQSETSINNSEYILRLFVNYAGNSSLHFKYFIGQRRFSKFFGKPTAKDKNYQQKKTLNTNPGSKSERLIRRIHFLIRGKLKVFRGHNIYRQEPI